MKKVFLVCIALLLVVVPTITSAQDQFVFGIVLVGSKNDHGWSQAHYEAGEYVEQHIPGSKMLVFESLNTADHPETSLEDVVASMVDQGAQLIFTTSDEFEEDTDTVARNFPDVKFVSVTGSRVLEGLSPSNVSSFDGLMEVPEAISGCAAALTTHTGQIGYVGPLINYETRRLAASAYLGAKYCWENYRGQTKPIQFNVTWIGFWFGIPGVTLDPTEEATHFFDSGADVVIGALDTPEAVQVAGKRRAEGDDVYAIGYDSPTACEDAPNACLGAPYYNWGPQYVATAQEVMADGWKSAWTWIDPVYSDMNNLDTSIVGFSRGEGLSESASALLDQFISEAAAFGENPDNKNAVFLWQGPLNLQDGTPLAASGESVVRVQKLSDGLSIWYLPQLLEGMSGASTTQ